MTHSIKQSKKKTKKRSESSSSGPQVPVKVWQPGVDKLEEDEELQCDPSAYNSLHGFHIGWPCLRLRNLLGILLEFLKYPIFLGRDVSFCRNMELVTQWMMRIVIVRMIVKMKKKVVLGVLLCSCGR